MERDVLFLLRPGFFDGGEPWFCAACAQVEGLLSFYPHLRQQLDVRYVDFAHPRQAIVAELGEQHQSCPVLVVKRRDLAALPDAVATPAGVRFFAGATAIAAHFNRAYGTPLAHP